MTQQIKYKRVLLKLSGESLMGSDPFGINHDTIVQTVGEIAEIVRMGVQVGIVVGGGNIFRGVSAQAGSMDRATADYMGMMATVMNALALKDAFETLGIKARVQSALSMQQIAETYARPKAIQYLEEGKVVIFAAGTGNPFFTTDTAAALRGAEMNCDVMLKATNVDGVYTDFSQVPLPTLISAGARIALAADDPLLFRSRLVAQYEVARDVFGLSDEALADLARSSIDASLASPSHKAAWKADIDAWLAAEPVA